MEPHQFFCSIAIAEKSALFKTPVFLSLQRIGNRSSKKLQQNYHPNLAML
jgi:hypothetical protein